MALEGRCKIGVQSSSALLTAYLSFVHIAKTKHEIVDSFVTWQVFLANVTIENVLSRSCLRHHRPFDAKSFVSVWCVRIPRSHVTSSKSLMIATYLRMKLTINAKRRVRNFPFVCLVDAHKFNNKYRSFSYDTYVCMRECARMSGLYLYVRVYMYIYYMYTLYIYIYIKQFINKWIKI